MLPQHLITLLQETPQYQQLCQNYGEFFPLSEAPRSLLEQLCLEIEEKITAAIEANPNLPWPKLVRKNGLSATTLEELLVNDEPLDDKRQQKSLNALLVFLGIPHKHWEYFKRKELTGADAHKIRLVGRWFIFRYHDDKLQRTLLRITVTITPDLKLHASYRSIKNFIFENGEVILNDSYLTIRLNSDAKTIDICAPAHHFILEDKIFNGLIRSIQLEPYATKCVIMNADDSKENDSSIDKVHDIVHTSEEKPGMQALAAAEYDPIVVYLRQAHEKHGELRAPAFDMTFIRSIRNPETTAELHANDRYSAYQKILAEPWFSFSYMPGGFRVKKWTFTLDNVLRKATVICEQGAQGYQGTVAMHPSHLSLTLDASTEDYIHTFARKIDPKAQHTNLLAVTSEANGHSMDAYRELFVPASVVAQDSLPPLLPAETFLSYSWLQPWEKCYLFDHRDIVHFATTPDDLKNRMTNIRAYLDKKYIALIPYNNLENPDDKDALQLITLRINEVGETEERFSTNAGDTKNPLTPTTATGQLRLLNLGLWLSTNNPKGQRSEYFFVTSGSQSWFLAGITLSQDKHHRPCSDAVLAIELEQLPTVFKEKFEPGIIRRDTGEYKILDELITRHTKISIFNYFNLYPSIRYTAKDTDHADHSPGHISDPAT